MGLFSHCSSHSNNSINNLFEIENFYCSKGEIESNHFLNRKLIVGFGKVLYLFYNTHGRIHFGLITDNLHQICFPNGNFFFFRASSIKELVELLKLVLL